MELHILQLHGLAFAAACVVEEDLVIEAQAQFRHTRQEDPHLDGAHDLTAQDITVGTDQEVDRLDDVQEHLILPVFDALGAPGHCVGDGGWGPWGPCFQLVAFLSDVPVGPGSELSSSGTDILENSPSLQQAPEKAGSGLTWGHLTQKYLTFSKNSKKNLQLQ